MSSKGQTWRSSFYHMCKSKSKFWFFFKAFVVTIKKQVRDTRVLRYGKSPKQILNIPKLKESKVFQNKNSAKSQTKVLLYLLKWNDRWKCFLKQYKFKACKWECHFQNLKQSPRLHSINTRNFWSTCRGLAPFEAERRACVSVRRAWREFYMGHLHRRDAPVHWRDVPV